MENTDAQAASPLLSIIIPVRNQATELTKCLESIVDEPGHFDIVVVDGESDDGSIRAASAFPNVKIISSPPGPAAQMNAGTRVAYGSTLMFLPADTVLMPGWYDEALRFSASPEFCCGTYPVHFGAMPWKFRILAYLMNVRTAWLQSPHEFQCLLVRRSTFMEHSGFRDKPFRTTIDFFKRLKKRGKLFVASCKVSVPAKPWMEEGLLRRTLRLGIISILYKAGVPLKRISHFDAAPPLTVAIFGRFPTSGFFTNPDATPKSGESIPRSAQLALLSRTYREVSLAAKSIVFFRPREQPDFLFHQHLGYEVRCRAQAGGHTGRRMEVVFRDLVGATGAPAIVIETNVPQFTAELLRDALRALDRHDAVIGSTSEGEFYLLGLNKFSAGLLDQINWNTATTFDDIMKRFRVFGFSVYRLPELPMLTRRSDIETICRDEQIDPELKSQLLDSIA